MDLTTSGDTQKAWWSRWSKSLLPKSARIGGLCLVTILDNQSRWPETRAEDRQAEPGCHHCRGLERGRLGVVPHNVPPLPGAPQNSRAEVIPYPALTPSPPCPASPRSLLLWTLWDKKSRVNKLLCPRESIDPKISQTAFTHRHYQPTIQALVMSQVNTRSDDRVKER